MPWKWLCYYLNSEGVMKNLKKQMMVIALVLTLMVPVISFARVNMVPADFSQLAEDARPAVVNIRTVKDHTGRWTGI